MRKLFGKHFPMNKRKGKTAWNAVLMQSKCVFCVEFICGHRLKSRQSKNTQIVTGLSSRHRLQSGTKRGNKNC